MKQSEKGIERKYTIEQRQVTRSHKKGRILSIILSWITKACSYQKMNVNFKPSQPFEMIQSCYFYLTCIILSYINLNSKGLFARRGRN